MLLSGGLHRGHTGSAGQPDQSERWACSRWPLLTTHSGPRHTPAKPAAVEHLVPSGLTEQKNCNEQVGGARGRVSLYEMVGGMRWPAPEGAQWRCLVSEIRCQPHARAYLALAPLTAATRSVGQVAWSAFWVHIAGACRAQQGIAGHALCNLPGSMPLCVIAAWCRSGAKQWRLLH